MTGLIVLDSDLNDTGERLCRGCLHPIKEPDDCPNCGKYGMYHAKRGNTLLYAQSNPLGYYVFGVKEKARMEIERDKEKKIEALGPIFISLEKYLSTYQMKWQDVIKIKKAHHLIRDVLSELENGKE